ncbi:MAG: diaminopimelate decarboxylase [Chitinivibrionales bacterium]|nr:diaminopimelate decarboxylase [Chitinivibrionales bacterium]
MAAKTLPFTREQIEAIADRHPTPFHLYDEAAIRRNARRFTEAFAWNPGFREFFAVKAAPNPHIVALLRDEGFGVDCSSLAELVLAERLGIRGESIMFSSNDTPPEEFRKAAQLGAIINLDDITHIDVLEQTAGIPGIACFRYNPGASRGGNDIIGQPEQSKYGCTREQLFDGYRIMREKGATRFGIQTMVISNELNPDYFVDTANMMFDLVAELSDSLGIGFSFVNLGGGIGIPYRPEDQAVDITALGEAVRRSYEERIVRRGLDPLQVYMECGRMITGPYGYLVSRVLHDKRTYKRFVGVDASMANLMRPAIYGAYHHITVLGKENEPADQVCDVVGSLCENNDKFAIDRALPAVERGDLMVIHDAGAHGHAMGFNYNGKLRSAELLLHEDGSVTQIRRPETVDDYFATVDFSGLG